jgi:hypothetical protein
VPFWFQGTASARLGDDQEQALGALWTRLLAGAAFAVSGEEAEESQPGLMGRFSRMVERQPERRIETRATAILERRFGSKGSKGVVGLWNAACGALLKEDLGPALVADLQAAWRAVFHRPLEATSTDEVDPFIGWR